MTHDELRQKALALPMNPGVYIMMDKTGKVIYVCKAKPLKNRVSSYFLGDHEPKTALMISKINTFDVILANTEFEALVLENSLIKHHMPKYNIRLRDDKGYPFLRVDLRSEYPAFSIVSKPEKDGARYLGPYGGRLILRGALEAVKKALKLPTCGKKFPRDIGRERPCLNHHMGACRAYCLKDASKAEYRESVESAIAIFEGKTAEIAARLASEMEEAAEKLQFELAAEKRDRLRSVQQLETKQFVVAGAMADTDIIGYYHGPVKSCFVVLHYIGGSLLDKEYELFDSPFEEDEETVAGLILQYYERRGVIPKLICLPCPLQDAEALEQLFTESSGHRVYVQSPQRGEKLKLVETANLNARDETERAATYEEKTLKTLEWLQKALLLEAPPERIEAYDISNTGSSEMVASMTVFFKGRPYKKDYRRFKIKTLDIQNDLGSMEEVLTRRIARYQNDDEKFAELPDLMLIDGGANHASTVRRVLMNAGVTLPVYGMVKDDRHRTRALVTPDGDEIGISANPAVFAFIGTIQEETHRFAIEYHRSLRSKTTRRSKLDEIEGVGEKRRNALLKSFGSLKAIAAASIDELTAVVPRNAAEKVYAHFHPESGEEVNPASTESE
jgi:excinuclease ABC subunit C